jgi:hypothetical protein
MTLKPMTIIHSDGSIEYQNPELLALTEAAIPDDLRRWIVAERMAALVVGEGLSHRAVSFAVDKRLGISGNEKAKSYRAINEYLTKKKFRGGATSRYVDTLETILVERVQKYFTDAPLVEAALPNPNVGESFIRRKLHQVDELHIGYTIAALEKPFGPDGPNLRTTGDSDLLLRERVARTVVIMYDDVASAAAWRAGLKDGMFLTQSNVAFLRAIVMRFSKLSSLTGNPIEAAANRVYNFITLLQPARINRVHRGTDPVNGPKPGMTMDLFLAYPEWRALMYAKGTEERTYTSLSYDEHGNDVVSQHTIRDIKKAVPVSQPIYELISSVLGGEDWRRLPISDEQKQAAALDHLSKQYPGIADLICDEDAIIEMFGGIEPSPSYTADDLTRRQNTIRTNPKGFLSFEQRAQTIWVKALELAEAKLRSLGMVDDMEMAVHFCSFLATRLFFSVQDHRFKINRADETEFEHRDFLDRAKEVITQLAHIVDRDLRSNTSTL